MREEEIRKALWNEIVNRQKMAGNLIRKAYEEERENYIKSFVNIIDTMLKKCINLQNPDGEQYVPDYEDRNFKGRLTYINISYMRTSIEDRSYKYLIRMYDDIKYYDRFEVEEKFLPEYRLKYQREDEEYFRKQIVKRIIRVKKYEVKDFLREYMMDTYIKPIPYEVEDSIEKIKKLDNYEKVQKDSKLALYYGEISGKDKKIFFFT